MALSRCWADRFFGNQPREDRFLLFGNNSLGDHCSCFIPLISSCWLVYPCINQFWFLIEMITFSKVLHHIYKSKVVQFCRFSFLTEIEHHCKTFCWSFSLLWKDFPDCKTDHFHCKRSSCGKHLHYVTAPWSDGAPFHNHCQCNFASSVVAQT